MELSLRALITLQELKSVESTMACAGGLIRQFVDSKWLLCRCSSSRSRCSGSCTRPTQNSFFVRELSKTFPNTSLDSILRAVRAIQANATALGIVGGAFLLWSSLSFFSVLESAFNIVYGRPNRGFLHGKALATMMMVGSLVFLFASLVVGSIGQEILKRYFGFAGNATPARVIAIVVSALGLFVFLASAYYVLTNADLTCARCCRARSPRR